MASSTTTKGSKTKEKKTSSTTAMKPSPNGKSHARVYQNFIAGKWCDSSTGEVSENRNPANVEDLVGTFPRSTKEDVDRAVKSAKKAFAA